MRGKIRGWRRTVRISLRDRLMLAFFAITLLAVAALYLYVAPGLQSRLMNSKLSELAAEARGDSGHIAATVGGSQALPVVRARVDAAALASGARVTLLLVTLTPNGVELSPQADSSTNAVGGSLAFPIAYDAIQRRIVVTGTESVGGVTVAEAAYPVLYHGVVGTVIVYSARISDILRSVATVRHEILVAGAIALLLGLLFGYLIARTVAQRVRRLELAAEQVAAGDFEHPIAVDSTDELGQLTVAFNAMQRKLAQLESTRKKFIATASHELRTPIFSLGGFVELLEDEDLDPETRQRFLEQVKDQVERLRKLSVDLLDLSRLESGSLELRPEHVDIGELTRSVSGEFEPALARHDAHLELRFASRTIDAVCDPVRVAQIVRILIDNALIHTPAGTRIVVTAGRDDGHIRLAVRDNGEGIERQSMPRIFEPFYTADDAQGSGLGLAIASELAERMSGRLSATSEPSATTFTLELPG